MRDIFSLGIHSKWLFTYWTN